MDEFSIGDRTNGIEVPPDFIQDVSATVPYRFLACILFGDFLKLFEAVRGRGGGGDVRSLEPFVSRQAFKQVDGSIEESNNLRLRFVGGAHTVRFGGADASTMLGPFMLPESFIVPVLILPILFHER